MTERRQQERKKFAQTAWAELGGERIECRVVEISKSGARLEIPAVMPHLFRLYLASDREIPRRCQVVWQEGNRVGINFLGLPQGAALA